MEISEADIDRSWYTGPVLSRSRTNIFVEYKTLMMTEKEEFDFQGDGLRLQRERVKGVWVPPLNEDKGCVRQEEPRKNWEQNGMMDGNKQYDVANRSVNPNMPDRPVESIDKNWIVGLWLLMVLQICLVVYMNISTFYLVLRDEPEQLLYAFPAMLAISGLCGVVVGSQLQWLVQRSEYADDVPWWCYGCTPSTRPRKSSK
ncbi:hypothetical protein DCAR_0415232 [Daucus carota subsp. sativus]|uniref:Uncharacterized protein n=1 Tax=Daucus carota subsp. sativus TaxID=79200 RepID=A0A165A8Z9_DAUCS|nr:hypothetical protein DCAR_0415232 [Daucus carota subsp. sativus]